MVKRAVTLFLGGGPVRLGDYEVVIFDTDTPGHLRIRAWGQSDGFSPVLPGDLSNPYVWSKYLGWPIEVLWKREPQLRASRPLPLRVCYLRSTTDSNVEYGDLPIDLQADLDPDLIKRGSMFIRTYSDGHRELRWLHIELDEQGRKKIDVYRKELILTERSVDIS